MTAQQPSERVAAILTRFREKFEGNPIGTEGFKFQMVELNKAESFLLDELKGVLEGLKPQECQAENWVIDWKDGYNVAVAFQTVQITTLLAQIEELRRK